jgi:uncharacterized protein (TIGR02598 family)
MCSSYLDNLKPKVILRMEVNLSFPMFEKSPQKIKNYATDDAFSLVEVVIAVGVAAFALVALLGLLPSGLKTFKSTMNTAVGSQIAQRVFNDMQIANWEDLTNTVRYFDEQGNELTNATSSNALNCIYWVQVNTTNAATRTNSTQFLGNTSTNLMTVTVMVANNPGGGQAASVVFNSTNPNTLTYTTLIGRNK